ncbi:ABC transporter permease [Luteimicrobium subarcticum]|uniref:Monosaccharide ABC transporter membrane protein (CUT2 family) n=1 Tax=Luteimicrobium subarcticum TaxID=620910 RepID=A0A2M8WVT9_9MICO|nr:ABC transporter permease [Luteimicrobium subarcticum]PJI95039.1 monosaccharide ABC transporter membrane protein (CUT2 family) [Luteimicrobium subarcticum]
MTGTITGADGRTRFQTTVARVTGHQLFWPVVALVVLLLACGIVSPGFLDVTVRDGHLFGQPVDILRQSATPLLLAIGMCLVIATGGIDLSVGAVMAISLAVSLTYIAESGTGSNLSTALTGLFLGLVVALAIGVFNGFLVTVLGIQPFIATLILMIAGRGIAMLVTKGQITTVTSPPFKSIGSGFVLGIPTPVIIAGGVFVLVALLVRRTALGMLLESIGINREASRLAGVKSRNITWFVYILCGLLAGLAGIVYGAPTMAADSNNIGLMKELDAIMVVVLGGTKLDGGKFSLAGTIVGALILTTLERAVVIFHLPTQVTPLFKALVLIVVCVAGSERLRGKLKIRRTSRPVVAAEVAA